MFPCRAHSSTSPLRRLLGAMLTPLLVAAVSATATGQSNLLAWGDDREGQCYVPAPPAGENYVEVVAGLLHTVARLSDDSVVAWGYNYSGQCDVLQPPAGESYVQLDAGWLHTVALVSNGTIVGWGGNYSGQLNIPSLPPGLSYLEVRAGAHQTVALVSDGSVLAWGYNQYGECDVPPPPAGLTYVEVDAGLNVSAGRLSDGSVVVWGNSGHGATSVPPLPAGETYVQVDAHWSHLMALLSDGSAVAWGYNFHGQTNVPAPPAGLTFVEVAVGQSHSLGRLSDGSVIAWGQNTGGGCNVPATPPGGYVALAAGSEFSLALSKDPIGTGYCTAGVSSNGCQALISVAGSPSATSASGFDLRVFNVEGAKPGLFVYGSNGKQTMPWGNGTSWRCVVPPVKRATRAGFMTSSGTPGFCDGYFEMDLHDLWTRAPAKNPGPGLMVQAQFWYRDPMNTSYRKTAFSDATEFFVVP